MINITIAEAWKMSPNRRERRIPTGGRDPHNLRWIMKNFEFCAQSRKDVKD